MTPAHAPKWHSIVAIEVLKSLSDLTESEDGVRRVMDLLVEHTGAEVVALRLERQGHFPFEVHRGLSEEHARAEGDLRPGSASRCIGGKSSSEGDCRLECLCGHLLKGDADRSLPGMTPTGSFFTGSFQKIQPGPWMKTATLRDRCHAAGFQTHVLIPVRRNERVIGLMQLSDRREQVFSEEDLRFLEEFVQVVGPVLAMRQREAERHELQERLGIVLKSASAGIVRWNPETRALSWSEEVGPLFGIREGEKSPSLDLWLSSVHEGDRSFVEKSIRQQLVVGKVSEVSWRVLDRDGKVRWLAAMGRPETNGGEGGLSGYVWVVFDATKAHASEDLLATSQQNLEMALRAAHMGAWRLNIKSNQRVFDRITCRLLGLDPTSFQGTAEEFFGRIHPDDVAGVKSSLARTIETGEPYEVEYRVAREGGSWGVLCGRGRMVRDEKGAPDRIHGVVFDVTETRRLERERVELLEKLQHSRRLETLGTLAGEVAHDFKNFLAVILGNAGLLKKRAGADSPLLGLIEKIELSAEKANRVSMDLLGFSRKQSLEIRDVDLGQGLDNTLKQLPKLLGENVQLCVESTPEPMPFRGDLIQIERVIMNLATNARDAMPQGGKLTIRIERQPLSEEKARGMEMESFGADYARIEVRDTGTGMDEETAKRVFEPFFTTKEAGKGSGLGLAMAFGTIRQHGGSIHVETQPGQGSCFVIYLPLLAAPVSKPQAEVKEAVPAELQGFAGSETILVVDDEPEIRSIVREFLEMAGYRVFEAGDGEEALAVVDRERGAISLVITDVIMPKMGGVDMFVRLRQMNSRIKAIFMSAFPSDMVFFKGTLEGKQSFFTKPLQTMELMAEVRRCLDEAKTKG
jgi:signal transduction histidine kinase/ActR/RegA family two-component response regulator